MKVFDNLSFKVEDFQEKEFNRLISDWVKESKTVGNDSIKIYRIVGITSINTLILSVNHPIGPQKKALHIRYYPKEDLWSFVYYFAPFSLTRFSRTYPGEQGIEKFDQFIHWMRW